LGLDVATQHHVKMIENLTVMYVFWCDLWWIMMCLWCMMFLWCMMLCLWCMMWFYDVIWCCFYDVLWCDLWCMMCFCDVFLWCIVCFYDVWCVFMIYMMFLWCIMMFVMMYDVFYDVLWCVFSKKDISEEVGHQVYKAIIIMDLEGLGMKHISKNFYNAMQKVINIDQYVIYDISFYDVLWSIYDLFYDVFYDPVICFLVLCVIL